MTISRRPKSPRQHHLDCDEHSIEKSLGNHLIFTGGKTPALATARDWYESAAHTVRDHLIERWVETLTRYEAHDPKRVYYLSLEFLIGRTLSNAAHNLDIEARLSRLTRWVLLAREAGLTYALRLPGSAYELGSGDEQFERCLEALALYEPGKR